MRKSEGAHQQAGDDLVADAEHQRAVEHVVREGHRRGERDGVAREQRQLHADLALRDTIAHSGHAARELRRGAEAQCFFLDDFREGLVRLVGG